jgi:integrase
MKGRDRGIYARTLTGNRTVWYARFAVNGQMQTFGHFDSKQAARDFYHDAKRDARLGQFFPEQYRRAAAPTIAECIDAYLERTKETKASHRDDVRYGKWWKARLGAVTLPALTGGMIQEAGESLRRDGREPQTVVNYLAFLRRILNLCVKRGYLRVSPFAQVELPRAPLKLVSIYTPEEEARIWKALGRYGPIVRLLVLTGMRRGELLRLRKEQLRLSGQFIELPTTKARKPQIVPLSKEACDLFHSWLKSIRQDSPYVFPSRHGRTPINPDNFYRRIWKPAMVKAELPKGTIHMLRHTFASRLTMSGYPDRTVAAMLRHASTALINRYSHFAPGYLSGPAEAVSQFKTATKLQRRKASRSVDFVSD